MTAEIISVGTELLLGDILNTNAQYLAGQLAALGLTVHYQSVVGDNPARLRNFLQMARDRSDVLLITGGLGPTGDDITKETAAIVFGDTLVPDPEELASLEAFFAARGREMTENNRKQAMVPKNGRKLPNPNGTAPGACFRHGNKFAFLLPGPPMEMVPMFEASVLPALQAMQDSSIRSLTLRVAGIGESDLENRAYQLLINSNPTAALYAKTAEVHIRITAKALTAAQAEVMCAEYAQMFRELLGEYIYGEDSDSLESVVVSRLAENGETVATAESCTGGLLSQRLTAVPGASGVFGFGAVSYANQAKRRMLGVSKSCLRRYGAVSGQVAAEMALGARRKGRASYGVGITGIAGPGGGSSQKPVGLVYIAVAGGSRVYVRKINAGGRSREYVRTLAAQNALDMLRRLAWGYTLPDARAFRKSEIADVERQGRPAKKAARPLRVVFAVLLTLALLAGLVFGLNALRPAGESDAGAQTPGALGYEYGTAEYAEAAMAYVAAMNRDNPAVAGFLAFPGQLLEQAVERVTTPQAGLLQAAQRQDRAGLAAIAAQAVAGRAGTNAAIAAGQAMEGLAVLANAENMALVSGFRYYTALEEQVYQIYAVYEIDEGDNYGDGFDPLFTGGLNETETALFALGAKMRSVYEIDLSPAPGDSLMTLCIRQPGAQGRWLYVCGLLAANEQGAAIAPAGQPLRPMAEYSVLPDVTGLYAHWLARSMLAGLGYGSLQLEAGMPGADLPPLTLLSEPEPLPEPGAEQAQAEDDRQEDDAQAEADQTPQPTPAPQYEKPDTTTLTVTLNGEASTAPVGEILSAICQYEGATLEDEAVKALAICAHSWILNQQGAGNKAPEVLGALPSPRISALVAQVEGLMLSPEGMAAVPAFTPWHQTSARATFAAQDIFGGQRDYLVQLAAGEETLLPGWRQDLRVSTQSLKEAALRLGAQVDDSLPADRWLGKVVAAESGYVESITLFGQSFTGLELWQSLLDGQGQRLLNSPAFEIGFTGEDFRLLCYGRGHGVGLSLAGAGVLAAGGWDYTRILAHYFPGAELQPW